MTKKRVEMSLDLAKFICDGSRNKTLSNDELRIQVQLGRLPKLVLTSLNIPDLMVVTSVSLLVKLEHKHKIGPAVMSMLHELIGNPSAVFKSATQAESIVIVTVVYVDGNPLIASIVVDTPDSFGKPNMHWMTSAYGKDNHQRLVDWEQEGLLLWRP